MAQAKVSDRPPLASIVGANVFRLRVLRLPKMSQQALANAAGVALNTVALVEELMGHADASQLRRYAAPSDPNLRAAVEAL
jgi:hypothetical protein